MINVIARISVLPGKMDEFMQLFKANVPNVLAEKGCHRYEPCTDVVCDISEADSNAVTVMEMWESVEHLRAHLATPHMKAFAQNAAPLRSGTKLTIVEVA